MNPRNNRILIVDDMHEVLDSMTQGIKLAGDYDVITTTEPASGIAIVQAHEPFLVLADLHMGGGMDGASMATKMHQIHPVCIYVAVSGYISIFDIGYLLGTVFFDVLQKPVSVGLLKKIVQQCDEKYQRWQGMM